MLWGPGSRGGEATGRVVRGGLRVCGTSADISCGGGSSCTSREEHLRPLEVQEQASLGSAGKDKGRARRRVSCVTRAGDLSGGDEG